MTDDLSPVWLSLRIQLSPEAQKVIERMTGSRGRPDQIAYLRRAMNRELIQDAAGWGGWEPTLRITEVDE